MRKNLGVALSGGGIKAFSQVGVLRFLKENGFVFDGFAGTSMGAIVATLMAHEIPIDKIENKISLQSYRTQDFLKITQKPILDPTEPGFHRTGLLRRLQTPGPRQPRLFQQTHHRCRTRVGDHIGQRAVVGRVSPTNWFQKNILGQFDHSRHHRRSTRQHNPAGQQFLIPAFADDLVHQRKYFLNPRFDHAGQRLF